MKVLLAGKNGQIGGELEKTLADLGEVTALDRQAMDLSRPDAIREQIRRLRPDIIVNAAAYTAVDQAESELELAMAVNASAPAIMAEEAQRLGAVLVHYSTDYVFDGKKSTPYVEQDAPNPLGVYGRSKLAGEQAICAQAARYLIFRTAWVYDAHGKNFLNTIRRVGEQRSELAIVDDQIGAPTWSRDIAQATARAIALYMAHPAAQQLNGVYHMSARGQTSWFGFAQAAAKHGLFTTLVHAPTLRAIRSAEFPSTAQRPMYSVLSNAKLHATFGIELPDWETSLRQFMGLNTALD